MSFTYACAMFLIYAIIWLADFSQSYGFRVENITIFPLNYGILQVIRIFLTMKHIQYIQ